MDEDEKLSGDVAKVLEEELSKLIEGAARDLQLAAARLSANAVSAAALGRQDLIDECRATARLLLEEHRLRAVGSSWTAVEAVVGAVIRTLAIAAASAGRAS